jgi:hypothetical protein
MSETKFKWNSEKWLSISAIAISFLTLVIFVYQTNLLSKQNYLSILPYLALSKTENKGDHIFELNLENHGVGPAIIESVTLSYKGKKYDLGEYGDEISTFFASIEPALDSLKIFSYSTVNKGLAIPANSKYNLMSVKNSQEDYDLMVQSLNRFLEAGFDYEIIYKSIQNERWIIHSRSEGPEQLD